MATRHSTIETRARQLFERENKQPSVLWDFQTTHDGRSDRSKLALAPSSKQKYMVLAELELVCVGHIEPE
ncbi:hypothetical protein [Bosea sp. PAMC 26642]|uniref:hypothetical protein n=1 Tax=Bosea sp. (strain PAMC 26642) TaxID=1792307 RepID=UPI0007704CB0|nr:hypothetical protein [Bosea sp. PAMC 26642]AMJ60976.1 hypothetical protein AXW83_12300 [Bosea sp. PAMC 26642]